MRLIWKLSFLLLTCCTPLLAAAESTEAARLHAIFAREWEEALKENPMFATSVGRNEYNALMPSATMADLERQVEDGKALMKELDGIDRAKLPPQDAVSYDMFRREVEDGLESFSFGAYQIPWNADSGFHSGFARQPEEMPFLTVQDYENYIARVSGWPKYVGEMIELIRMGIQRGMVLPRIVLNGYETTISAHVVDDPTKSVFWKPFERFPETIPVAERERLKAAGRKMVMESAVAGYRTLLDFYLKEYLPNTRPTIGASELPDGRAFYSHLIRHFTTLDLSPEEIHKIGLAEVERIRGEMLQVIQQVGFKGDLKAFIAFLRTDPQFYAKTPEELLSRAAWIVKRMDGKLPALFKTLPRQPYTVEPVPDHMAPKYTSGRYVEAAPGSTQSGIYWVNTYKLDSRPLYNLEALSLHEAVPGHHLQIALGHELDQLPEFRRFYYISAFGEGWGLYSEWLGLEAGFYTDPYSNFGRLTYEMWRACRLVVDTGLHAMGWTRQQAIDFLAGNTALPLHEVETETDRYISWPAQALSYKLGELKIKELRRKAQAALGPRFDVRAFHDTVLGSGAVPLDVLEKNVERFIAEGRAAEARSSP